MAMIAAGVKKHWFNIGILLVIALAFQYPTAGQTIRDWKILRVSIFAAFLISGMNLETRCLLQEIRRLRTIAAALASIFIMFPLLALGLAWIVFKNQTALYTGVAILAVSPVTLVSGIVVTGIAGGNTALSIFIVVISNLVAIFSVPLSLSLLLQTGPGVHLPVLQMIGSLVLVVLIPIGIGQALRRYLNPFLAPYQTAFSVFSQSLVLLIVFSAVASSKTFLLTLGWEIAALLAFVLILHLLVLLTNFGLSKAIRLDLPSAIAFTFQASQKALVVAYLVWLDFFSVDFPMALIVPTAYHLTQVVADAWLAGPLRRRI